MTLASPILSDASGGGPSTIDHGTGDALEAGSIVGHVSHAGYAPVRPGRRGRARTDSGGAWIL